MNKLKTFLKNRVGRRLAQSLLWSYQMASDLWRRWHILVLTLFLGPFTAFGAENCDAYFLRSALVSAAESACRQYKEQYCGKNSVRVIQKLVDLVGQGHFALDEVKVHFIFHKDFSFLRPSNVRIDGVVWRYHVIVESPVGIVDLDYVPFIENEFEPIPRGIYTKDIWARHEGQDLENILTVAVPAESALKNWPGEFSATQAFELVTEPKGWVPRALLGGLDQAGEGFWRFFTRKGLPDYYILSQDAWEAYPPVPVKHYFGVP